MVKSLLLEKIEEIKKLCRQGLAFVKGFIPLKDRKAQNICYIQRKETKCTRSVGHRGVHLANDRRGRLINWE